MQYFVFQIGKDPDVRLDALFVVGDTMPVEVCVYFFHEKLQIFAYAETKAQISCAVTAQLISAFIFTSWIVQFLFLLHPKFQASSPLV